MRVILKARHIVLVAETDAERQELGNFASGAAGHVFRASAGSADGMALSDLGPHEEACREPINVTSVSRDPSVAILGNFAPTPFTLDGRRYESVESFWQGLKFDDENERARFATLDGRRAKGEGSAASQPATFVYEGETVTTGTWKHWRLMERACRAKFAQNADAAAALLATGSRPLEHIVKPDSKTIPGVIMAQIWMRLRGQLRGRP